MTIFINIFQSLDSINISKNFNTTIKIFNFLFLILSFIMNLGAQRGINTDLSSKNIFLLQSLFKIKFLVRKNS